MRYDWDGPARARRERRFRPPAGRAKPSDRETAISTTDDNTTHTNATIAIGSSNDLVFGAAAFWTMSGDTPIATLAGSNLFRNAGQVYANFAAVLASGDSVRVENLATGVIGASDGAAIQLRAFSTLVNAGYVSGVIAIEFTGLNNTVVNAGTLVGMGNTVDFGIGIGTGNERLTNSGSIVSSGDDAIQFDGAGTNTIVNHGLISAPLSTAILALGTAANTITNDGVIEGSGAISLSLGNDVVVNTGTISGTVLLFEGDDLFDSSAGTLSGRVNGGSGDDTVIGGAIGERLEGSSGDDLLIGNGGNDVLRGGGGADELDGGSGDDTYIVDDARDRTVELAGSGADLVRATASHTLQAFVENLTLLGNGAIDGTGNDLVNIVTGNGGANVLNGRLGSDSLTGGGAADTFRFDTALDAATNVDTVNDFLAGTDKLSLSRTIFTEVGGGTTLQASRFVIGGAALDSNDRIIYNSTTKQLFYDPDGDGALAQVQFAQLSVGLPLAATDFVLTG